MSGGGVYTADGNTIKLLAGQFSLVGLKFKSLAADLPGINGTQAALAIALPAASQRYAFMGALYVTGAATTPQNFQVHVLSGGATLAFVFSQNSVGAAGTAFNSFGTASPITAVTTNFAGSAGTSVPAAGMVITFYGILSSSGSPATTLQIDQVDTGTTNTLKLGSWLGVAFTL